MSSSNLNFVWLHASILRTSIKLKLDIFHCALSQHHRNPGTSPRPSFRDLVLTLVGKQQLVLSITQDAIETHQLAGVLGAPLEAGEKMYQDLQYTYVK